MRRRRARSGGGGEVKVVRPGFGEGVEDARAGEAERLLEDEDGRAASVVCLSFGARLLWAVDCGGLVGTLGPPPLPKHSSSPMPMVLLGIVFSELHTT